MNVLKNNNLLTKVVTNVETSRSILICDRLGNDCRSLVQTLVYNRLKRFDVNMVCIEKHSNVYLDSMQKPFNTNGIKTIDLFNKYDSIETNLSQHLIQCLTDLSNESIVLIDSLTPILLTDGLYEMSSLLKELSNRFQQWICVLHVDCHPQHVIQSLEQLSDSVIHLSTTKSEKTQNCLKAYIRHRKAHRKTHFSVQQSIELFTICDNTIEYIKDNNNETNSGQTSIGSTSDPTFNLPFNLNIKDNELEAKNSLLLPYIKTHNETKVYYEFDKNDDFDEEDPDEDLEI